MKYKNKKKLEIMCFILILICFSIIGYYTYKSYNNQKENKTPEIIIDNYYDIEYLFNTGYLKKANNISEFSNSNNDIYMYLDKEKTLYIKYTNGDNKYNKKITGLPQDIVEVFYNNLYDNTYELSALNKDGKLFYTQFNLKSKKDYKFEEINSNINSIYTPVYDKKYVYINNNSIKTNFIFLNNNNELMYLDKEDNYILKEDISKVKPYFDYICASNNSSLCNDIIIYQNFENKLVYNNQTIKNDKNEEIISKDIFATLEINSKKELDLENITYKKLIKYDYLYSIYVVEENNKIYKIDINKNKEIETSLFSTKKVKELKYKEDNSLINIIYNDGTSFNIKKEQNKNIITSTTYDKINKKL